MAKISKNIKRLRNENNITQEMLAEQLNVTRQTISSWENDRTQPDIDMLEALSSVLNTDIEELIYGKKRNVGLEADNSGSRKLLTVILSVAGSLLTAAGLIILFVNIWQDLSSAVKTVFAFLPLAAGSGFGLFAVFRKKTSAVWCESGALLWIAGAVSTNALVNALYSVDFGFLNLLLADILLTGLIMFLLDSVVSFTACTAMISVWAYAAFENADAFVESAQSADIFKAAAVLFALLILPVVFTVREMRREKPRRVTVWVALSDAAFVLALLFTVIQGVGFFASLAVFSVTAFLLLSEERLFSGYSMNRILVFLQPVCILSFVLFSSSDIPKGYAGLLDFSVAALLIGSGAFLGKANLKKNIYLMGTLICSAAEIAVNMAVYLLRPEHDTNFVMYISVALLSGVFAIVAGVKNAGLFRTNIGLLTVFASLIILLAALDASAVFIGAALLVTGVVLLGVNKIMIKRFKTEKDDSDPAPENGGDGGD